MMFFCAIAIVENISSYSSEIKTNALNVENLFDYAFILRYVM